MVLHTNRILDLKEGQNMGMDPVAGSCQDSVKLNRFLCAVCGSQQDMLTGNLPFLNLQFVKLSESIGSGNTTNFRFCKLFV
jgi:hypothetical protein